MFTKWAEFWYQSAVERPVFGKSKQKQNSAKLSLKALCFFRLLHKITDITLCLKITEKVSFNVASEASGHVLDMYRTRFFKSTKSSNYVYVLYSDKIFSNISKCLLTLDNSFSFFSTVFISLIGHSWKESKRILKD